MQKKSASVTTLNTYKEPRLQTDMSIRERQMWQTFKHLLLGRLSVVVVEICPGLFSSSACVLFRLQREA